jgi:hypothetical protein
MSLEGSNWSMGFETFLFVFFSVYNVGENNPPSVYGSQILVK